MLIFDSKKGRFGTQKPKQWGPLSAVRSAVFRNAEVMGIDPESIKLLLPFWDGCSGTKNTINGDSIVGDTVYNNNNSLLADSVDVAAIIDSSVDIQDFFINANYTSQSTDPSERYAVGNAYADTDGIIQLGFTSRKIRAYIKDGSTGWELEAETEAMVGTSYNVSLLGCIDSGYTKLRLFIDGIYTDHVSTASTISMFIPTFGIGARQRDGYIDAPLLGDITSVLIFNGVKNTSQKFQQWLACQLSETPYALLQPNPTPLIFDWGATAPSGWQHKIFGITPTKVYGVEPTKVTGV